MVCRIGWRTPRRLTPRHEPSASAMVERDDPVLSMTFLGQW
jgi:hypothetical protein